MSLTAIKDKSEKRKKDSPAEGEGESTKRTMSIGGNGTDYEEEDRKQEELDAPREGVNDTVIEVISDDGKEEDEEEWNRNMEETVEKCNIREVQKLLKMVMADYRGRAKDLEREKVKLEKQDHSELIKGFETMIRHIDESNEKWGRGMKE